MATPPTSSEEMADAEKSPDEQPFIVDASSSKSGLEDNTQNAKGKKAGIGDYFVSA